MTPSSTSTAAIRHGPGGSNARAARKRRRHDLGADAEPGSAGSLHGCSAHGELWFRLQQHQGGLYVEREEILARGQHQLQSVFFRQARDFEQWCDTDPVRFELPHLHTALKRHATQLWPPDNRASAAS